MICENCREEIEKAWMHQSNKDMDYFVYLCSPKAERSEVLQGCPPSATGSASAATNTEQPGCGSDASKLQATSQGKSEDGPVADSSSVQLPVSDLVAAVSGEIYTLQKEIELMRLRVDESEGTPINKTLRSFGSCLWRHKRRLETALAAASAPGAAGASGGS